MLPKNTNGDLLSAYLSFPSTPVQPKRQQDMMTIKVVEMSKVNAVVGRYLQRNFEEHDHKNRIKKISLPATNRGVCVLAFC